MSNLIPGEVLLSVIERIERLHEEKKGIEEDIREIYAEVKGNGYSTKAIRALVKERGQDVAEREEHEAIVDLYREAIRQAQNPSRATRACPRVENIDEFRSAAETERGLQSPHSAELSSPAGGETDEDRQTNLAEGHTEARAAGVSPQTSRSANAPGLSGGDTSPIGGPILQGEGAKSRDVRTAGKSGKRSGGDRLPPLTHDPHRFGSFTRRGSLPDGGNMQADGVECTAINDRNMA